MGLLGLAKCKLILENQAEVKEPCWFRCVKYLVLVLAIFYLLVRLENWSCTQSHAIMPYQIKGIVFLMYLMCIFLKIQSSFKNELQKRSLQL